MDLRRFILVIAGVFVIVVLAVLIFGRGGAPKVNPTVAKNLPDYADTAVQVQFTDQGVINGDDAHREIVITVGQNSRTLTINQGYEGKVLKTQTIYNNTAAYKAFLSALNVSGFTKVKKSRISSEEGLCPLGQRYIFQVMNSDQNDLRTWSTSCNGPATFGGNFSTVQTLFQLQFANYDDFTSDVQL